MEEIYKSYICKGCGRTTILLTEEADKTITAGKYISCSHCGCKRLVELKSTSDLRDIMKARSYKRVNGAFKEVT